MAAALSDAEMYVSDVVPPASEMYVLAAAWSGVENWALAVGSPVCCSADFAVAEDTDNSLSYVERLLRQNK